MTQKRLFAIFSVVLVMMCFFASLAVADLIPLYRFKGVNIPVKLNVKDKSLEKGAYDLEFVRNSTPVFYYLRFMKRGKILDMIQAEEWPYGTGIVSDIAHDKNVPTSPTLKMAKNKDEKLWIFVFESGRNTLDYPLIRVRVKLPYEE
jgi:hypothetical protein